MKRRRMSIITQTFFKLLPVQILLMICQSINSVIDGTVASNLIGPSAIAVTGLMVPLIQLITTISGVLLGGSQILCGQFIGKNQVKRCSGIFSLDLLAAGGFGAVLALLCGLFPRMAGRLFVQDEALLNELVKYMVGFAPGIIPSMLVAQLPAFLQLERQELRTYIGMAVMIAGNIVMNVLFVSVLRMGLFGLGLATTFANLAYLLVLLSHYITKKATIRFSLGNIRPAELLSILRIGMPGAVSSLAQVFSGMLRNTMLLSFVGSNGMSAYAAVSTFSTVFFAATAGVISATRLLFSVYVGEEDRAGITDIMHTALTYGVGLVAGVAVLLSALSTPITCIFFRPEAGEVFRMTRSGFIMQPLAMPLSCVFCVYVNYYQCREQMGVVNLMSLSDGFFGVTLFSLILMPLIGMPGLWAAFWLNGLLPVCIIIGYTRLRSGKFPRSVADTLLMEEGFGVSEGDRIDISVRTPSEISALSENVVAFCGAHQVNSRRAMFAGLCVEEMTCNILERSDPTKKPVSIDVRVVYKPDGLMIRLKDDGALFNPKEVQDLFDPEDPTHNIGIRMTSKIAKSMTYQNSIGLNVLTITV